MKILHVISDTNVGGAGVLLCNLLSAFDKTQVASTVALPQGSALLPRIAHLGIPVRPLKHPATRPSALSVSEVRRVIRETGAELVHTNAALSARLAARMCGVPVLFTRHCTFPLSGIYRFAPARLAAGICNRMLCDRAIATADAAAWDLLQMGIPESRITRILNGSFPVRRVTKEETDAFRQRYKIAEDAFCVGICARLEPCKGHATLLQAIAHLQIKAPEIPFLFLLAGDGSLREELMLLSKKLCVEERVRFLGFLTDTAPFYRSLRINVNCSEGTETSSLALSEGMSVALPTVASDYGGNPDMLGYGEAGLLFPVGDARALSDALLSIACDPSLEARLSRAALSRYRTHYTAERMAEQTAALYARMLEG